jgi:hypothetical protein
MIAGPECYFGTVRSGRLIRLAAVLLQRILHLGVFLLLIVDDLLRHPLRPGALRVRECFAISTAPW